MSFRDINVRIEKMFWLPGMGEVPPRDFSDFFADDLDDYEPLKFGIDAPDAEEFAAELRMLGKTGFFVQLATPVPRSFQTGGGSYAFSWGHVRLRWVYVADLGELALIAEAFEKEVVESECRKKGEAA